MFYTKCQCSNFPVIELDNTLSRAGLLRCYGCKGKITFVDRQQLN